MMNLLYKEGVERARRSVTFYRKRASEFQDTGYSDEAGVLKLLMDSSEIHQDILNEMIDNLRVKVLWKEYLEKEE